MTPEPRKTTRRQALVVLGRLGALAGLVGGIGFLTAQSASASCTLRNPCDICSKFRNCDLDKALAARREAQP